MKNEKGVTHHALQFFEPGKYPHPGAQIACRKGATAYVPFGRWVSAAEMEIKDSPDRCTRNADSTITCPDCLRIGARGKIFAIHGVAFVERSRDPSRWRVFLRDCAGTTYDHVFYTDDLDDIRGSASDRDRAILSRAESCVRRIALKYGVDALPVVWLSQVHASEGEAS